MMASGFGLWFLAHSDPHAERNEGFGGPPWDGSTCTGADAQIVMSAAHCAAYDAAFLLPFTAQVIDLCCLVVIEVVACFA